MGEYSDKINWVNVISVTALVLGITTFVWLLVRQVASTYVIGTLKVDTISEKTASNGVAVTDTLTASDGLTVSGATATSIGTTSNTAGAITLNANGGTTETVLIRAQQGTSATSIDLVSTAGGITLDSATGVHINNAIFNAGSISGATTLTAATSGYTYNVSQAAAYAITLPAPAAGLNYYFILGTAGANAVTIGTASGANYLYGVLINKTTSVTSISAQDTLTFVSGTAAVGDTIELRGISSTMWAVRALTSAVGGITATAT